MTIGVLLPGPGRPGLRRPGHIGLPAGRHRPPRTACRAPAPRPPQPARPGIAGQRQQAPRSATAQSRPLDRTSRNLTRRPRSGGTREPPIGALFGPADRSGPTDRSGPARADGKLWGVSDRWPNYSKVRFRSDQHRANGVPEGSVGYIVEVYDDAYEVEVTEPETGETLFLGAVPDADLDLISGHGPVS